MGSREVLTEYRRKRDFSKTSEPRGNISKGSGNRFIVQKHAARRLHYDFRLEIDGVLKSWAVTKGPSFDPKDKRLAVRTEDHPLSYIDFEGTIPSGQYGGGTVMLWDMGEWEPVAGKSAKDLEEGHLHFTLSGERMRGEWLLVRMKPRPGEKRENWLLRKIEDEWSGSGDALIEAAQKSVQSGRTMDQIAAGENPKIPAKAKSAPRRPAKRNSGPPPPFQKLQLATLVDAVPTGSDWMHEIKYDGYRALIAASGANIQVFTRNGLDWTAKFQPLADKFASLNLPPCLIDGEIVALDETGNPSFSDLQAILKRGTGAQRQSDVLHFFAFDLLQLSGKSFVKTGNLQRKEKLNALLASVKPPLHLADHLVGSGEKLFHQMCKAGQEGIISKRVDGPYTDRRSKNWLKIKCTRRQEFIIVGWTNSTARGRPFASILLGQYENGTLVYKGKVGTGFNASTFAELEDEFRKVARKTSALEVPAAIAQQVNWLRPHLVAEIAFSEFTTAGLVRHGSFIGLREDKAAKNIVPEKKMPTSAILGMTKSAEREQRGCPDITNKERIIFPEAGVSKGDIAAYYQDIAPLMLAELQRRPLSLLRCPQGRAKHCFFSKA